MSIWRDEQHERTYGHCDDYAIITDMEPKLPAPNLGPEYSPPSYEQGRQGPQPEKVEPTIERQAERVEQRAESVAPTQPIVPVLPAPVPTVPATDDATQAVDDTPVVANDDDLIEKEWVEKAKKIIVQTKDDPYRREQEVGKLQADYLLKRYGKELGASQ